MTGSCTLSVCITMMTITQGGAALALGWYPPDLRPENQCRRPAKSKLLLFPGLWLDKAAMLRGDLGILDVIQRGAATPEHAAFIKRLSQSS